MNDFVSMLTATLRLANNNALRSDELAGGENPLIEEEDEEQGTSSMRRWTSNERTIVQPLHETNHLQQRCQLIRE